ncbi:FecR domain-containing protein, partial [Desulfobulbus sp. TB]|nr:FecR domain-containing protein [Desulfobulbus sp. TB]
MTTPSFFVKITVVAIAAILISPAIAQSFNFNRTGGTRDTLIKFLKAEHTPSRPLLPKSLVLTDRFRPSTQPFAGTITYLQGTAYVYHQNEEIAYIIQQDHPIFSGDTLVTTEKTKATLHLADNSVLFLTPHTKLLINRFLPRVKVRDTAMYLFFGKIRSLVQGNIGKYTIKTPTARLKVRGTDFIMAVAPTSPKKPTKLLTAVLTGSGQSNVELAGLFGPFMTLKSFSVIGVGAGNQAKKAVSVRSMASFLLRQIVPQEEQKPKTWQTQQVEKKIQQASAP